MKCLFSNKAEMRTQKGSWEAGQLDVFSDHLYFAGKSTTKELAFSLCELTVMIESYSHKVLFLTLPADCLHLYDNHGFDVVFYFKDNQDAQELQDILNSEKKALLKHSEKTQQFVVPVSPQEKTVSEGDFQECNTVETPVIDTTVEFTDHNRISTNIEGIGDVADDFEQSLIDIEESFSFDDLSIPDTDDLENITRDSKSVDEENQSEGNNTPSLSSENSYENNSPESPVQIGDTIYIGQYCIDNEETMSPIPWIVLRCENERFMVLSKYIIDYHPFHKTWETWHKCSLRKWLNTEFLEKTFSDTEREFINESLITCREEEGNPNYKPISTKSSKDYIFALSYLEATSYIPSDQLAGQTTAYSSSKCKNKKGKTGSKWWLRSPGNEVITACYVDEKGAISACHVGKDNVGVRPAMWLNAAKYACFINADKQQIPEQSAVLPNKDSSINNGIETNSPVTANNVAASDTNEDNENKEQKNNISSFADVNNDYSFKGNYLRACLSFADFSSNQIPEKRSSVHQSSTEKICSLAFDIINSRYLYLNGTGSKPMPTYMHPTRPQGRYIRCNDSGIYSDPCFSAYEMFIADPSDAQHEILRKSISDSTKDDQIKVGAIEPLCLMPDIVDDFSHGLRSQLVCNNGQRLFQVPRSIAMAYSMYVKSPKDFPEEFLVLDYDGEELNCIKVRKTTTKKGELVFVRMGRYPIEGNHPCYRTNAMDYLRTYSQKYGVRFSEKAIHDLVDTKSLQNLLLSDGSHPLLILDNGYLTEVWYDQDIVNGLFATLADDVNQIADQNGMYVYALCSFGYSNVSYIMNSDILEAGCLELIDRAKQNKPLWEEYLPELKLGVHKDGVFADLVLIGEKDRRQEIRASFIGKPQEFTVKDGTITLSKQKEYYDLPLEREVYGNMNKEKLARFVPEKPLDEDQEVQLKIYYTYGDVDSYKLIAITKNGTKIESEWCDLNILDNKAPTYSPAALPALDENECLEVVEGFNVFAERVKAPAAFRTDTIYCYKKSAKQLYSRYLRELNAAGFPFRRVRQYFSIDNQTPKVKKQIRDLLKAGVFDCVTSVVDGSLPRNHKLEVGTSFQYPEQDQKIILRENMVKLIPEFGTLFTIKHKSIENMVNSIQSRNSVQVWAPITAYITRADDYYGVWKKFSKSLYNMNPDNPLRTVYDLRAISNVCFLTKDWIFEFYNSDSGEQDVNWLIQNIESYLFAEEWNNGEVYNARKVRDVLELLLCVCLLKNDQNALILDCNASETRRLVKQLKKIDSDIRDLDERGLIDEYGKFNCRIQDVDRPDEYSKVNKVIYALVTALTGGSVNLVGFRSD